MSTTATAWAGWSLTDGGKEVLLATAQGMAIRFSEEEVRPMGLAAAGVNGIKLGVGDEVIGVQVLPAEGEVFLIASDGKAKRVEQKDFPAQGRYGKGVIGWELPARRGHWPGWRRARRMTLSPCTWPRPPPR